MAVRFTPAVTTLSPQLRRGAPLVTVNGFSVAAWVNPASGVGSGGDNVIWATERTPGQGFADFENWSLETRSSSGDNLVQANAAGPGFTFSGASTSVGSLTFGAWNFAGAVFSSTTSRQAFCNAIASAVDTGLSLTPTVGDTYIGSRVDVSGSFRPFNGCIGAVGTWNRPLSSAEMALLATGVDFRRISGLISLVQLINNSLKTIDLYGVPWTPFSTGGSFADCPDAPAYRSGIILPPVVATAVPSTLCGCDGAEDVDDAFTAADVTWPDCDLVPTNILVQPRISSASPGRSFTGRELVVQGFPGLWEITLEEIPVRSNAAVLLWREIESTLNGRLGTVLVPVYEGVTVGNPIDAQAASNATIGTVTLDIQLNSGPQIEPGMHFSAGERLYRVKTIAPVSSDIYRVKVWPPFRDAIASGDALEFEKPVCRCRLATDDAMAINLEILKFGKPTVKFVEAV